MKIKTVRVKYASTYHTYMLQLNGNTLQNLERVTRNGQTYYIGDYAFCYETIKEAKAHTIQLARMGRFGEIVKDWAEESYCLCGRSKSRYFDKCEPCTKKDMEAAGKVLGDGPRNKQLAIR